MILSAISRCIMRSVISCEKSLGQGAARYFSSTFVCEYEHTKSADGIEANGSPWGARKFDTSTANVDRHCVVNSHTEWDHLEEVIVGRVDGATIPEWHVSGQAVWPAKHWDMYKTNAGMPFPEELAKRGDSNTVCECNRRPRSRDTSPFS